MSDLVLVYLELHGEESVGVRANLQHGRQAEERHAVKDYKLLFLESVSKFWGLRLHGLDEDKFEVGLLGRVVSSFERQLKLLDLLADFRHDGDNGNVVDVSGLNWFLTNQDRIL